MSPYLLQHLFLIFHAVGVLGVGGWYLGLIPHGISERRFYPLGLYMVTCAVVLLTSWLAHYFTSAAIFLPVLLWLATGAALACLGRSLWLAQQDDRPKRSWPWSLRAFTFAHFLGTLALPLYSNYFEDPFSPFFSTGLAFGLIVVMTLSHISFVRRRGHQLHWSMAAVVLLCLFIGSAVIQYSFRSSRQSAKQALLEQVQTMADFLMHNMPQAESDSAATQRNITASLSEISRNSDLITSAFVIHQTEAGPEFLARVDRGDEYPSIATLEIDQFQDYLDTPAHAVPLSIKNPLKMGDGLWIALAKIPSQTSHSTQGIVGIVIPMALLASMVSHAFFATEIIVLIVALLMFSCLGAYLHGRLRIVQRDALIEISSHVTQELLQERDPQDLGHWLVEKLHKHLDLVYTAFWMCGFRDGQPGFREISCSSKGIKTSEWHSMSRMNPVWKDSLCNHRPLSGPLRTVGQPLPRLIPRASAHNWVRAQSISFKDQPWGAIVTVFSSRSHSSNRELGKTLKSIANAISSALNREERSESLAAAEERLMTMIETSQDGFWDADVEKNTCYRSQRWWEMLGYEKTQDADIDNFDALVHEHDLDRIQADRAKVLSPGRNHRRRLFRTKHQNGRWRWIESNMVELRRDRGPVQRAIGFDRDVTERMTYEKRLKEAAESSARANRAKSEFLATVSHELRTPLNSIIGFSGMLNQTPLETNQQDWVESVQTSGEQLLALISDLLDISKIEAGRLKLEIASLEILRACEQAMEHFRETVTEKCIGLHLEFDSSLTPAWVSGDALRIRQILTNIVGNAVKFTQTGQVVLKVTRNEDHIWKFQITDTGPGIPTHEIQRLFNRFEQIDTSSTRSHDGIGLGLAISRELAHQMSGDIRVESVVDQGSCFIYTAHLPDAVGPSRRISDTPPPFTSSLIVLGGSPTDLREIESIVADQNCQIENYHEAPAVIERLEQSTSSTLLLVPRAYRRNVYQDAETIREKFGKSHPLITFAGVQVPSDQRGHHSLFEVEFDAPLRRRNLIDLLCGIKPRNKKIREEKTVKPPSTVSIPVKLRTLVAEDNPMNRKLMSFMLANLGIEADFAEDGAIAIEMLGKKEYDFALVDIQMPQIDGIGVARWVKEHWHNNWPKPPLIAVTANVSPIIKQKCLAAGMVEIVSKPIVTEQLSTTIYRHCKASTASPDSTQSNAISSSDIPPDSARQPEPQTPPASPKSEYVDWPAFEAVCSLSGLADDPTTLKNLLRQYEKESQDILAQIELIGNTDFHQVQRLLHKLKGSTGSLGFQAASKSILPIHDAEDPVPILEILAGVKDIRTNISAAMGEIISRYPELSSLGATDVADT